MASRAVSMSDTRQGRNFSPLSIYLLSRLEKLVEEKNTTKCLSYVMHSLHQ